MAEFEKQLEFLCRQRGYDEEYVRAWMPHRFRLFLSMRWLRPIVDGLQAPVVGLELGAPSVVTDLLVRCFARVRWHNTCGDLCSRWQLDDKSVDLMVCMEVLEHLSPQPEGYEDTFRPTGVVATLRECFRVLRPGGYLFITTPNAASCVHLKSVLTGNAPWFYEPHIREYTPSAVAALVASQGFTVEQWRTVHCLSAQQTVDYVPLFRMLLEYGYEVANRGDDIFLLARRPS